MKKPSTNLDSHRIDEQIEHILQTTPTWQDEEVHYLRDLQYLYQKDEILARVQQRLGIAEQTPGGEEFQEVSSRAEESSVLLSYPQTGRRDRAFSWPKIAAMVIAAVLLIAAIIGPTSFFLRHSQSASGSTHQDSTPAPATATSTATPSSTSGSIIVSDPLKENIHNWALKSDSNGNIVFKDGALHITNLNSSAVIGELYPQNFPQTTLSYQLTMEEITGDDASPVNNFGMILCYNSQTVNGTQVRAFYTFEIFNDGAKSKYGFYKYDSRVQDNPWLPLDDSMIAGKELYRGQGSHAVNTVKVSMNESSFTFFVNGQLVGTASVENPLQPGEVGMIVNLKGTEVAFSNFLITQP